MAGKYLPPHLRGRGENSEDETPITATNNESILLDLNNTHTDPQYPPTTSTLSETTNLPIRAAGPLSPSQYQQRRAPRPKPTWERRTRGEGEITPDEIRDHFWQSQYERSQENGSETKLPPPQRITSTLNDSWQYRNQLSYLLLFPDANPRWESDGIIFAHTSIEMLPGYAEAFANPKAKTEDENMDEGFVQAADESVAADSVQSTDATDDTQEDTSTEPPAPPSSPLISHSIAVFTQTYPMHGGKSIYFRFKGWYRLNRVDFLHPNTQELGRMMKQKWAIKGRHGQDVRRSKSAWTNSMSLRWAVCKFEKCEEQDNPPTIELQEAITIPDVAAGGGGSESVGKAENQVDKEKESVEEGGDGKKDKVEEEWIVL